MNKKIEKELDKINELISNKNVSIFYKGVADVKTYIQTLKNEMRGKDELLMEALTKYVRLYEYKLSNIETDEFYEKALDYISKES